ncbi:kinase-like domain-containing protein [Pisolithus marmoratus]|nr:kinase-like domain-containing protein [Pisolithus marmoratus]
MPTSLELYERLHVIGHGSFGIIYKVRRKTDDMIFALKELDSQRMSEEDRKRIIAETNILKDLVHEHIVRYHDRHIDSESGIIYILMEYCGGGDLSCIIKRAQKNNRLISEDIIWHYFMEILLALQHCHHPASQEQRPQILHRDLKPDNVFLDGCNHVKLGDFGLSKALGESSFADTYVGTPYYMSPELVLAKPYDAKSDIWSLGCLIYELCALKPPFYKAKSPAELGRFIMNGRIPPLPVGYSQALSDLIKSMLNLDPAMRPSALQLLQHERLILSWKIVGVEKMFAALKTKERDISAREAAMAEAEVRYRTVVDQKDAEILRLRQFALVCQRGEREVYEAWSAREAQIRAESNLAVEEKTRRIRANEAQSDAVQRFLKRKLAELSWGLGAEGEALLPRVCSCRQARTAERLSRSRERRQSRGWMSGVVLTETGRSLATPPRELAADD